MSEMSQPIATTETGRKVYPLPGDNPKCVCTNPMQSFFCPYGHMLECHYPQTCREANCSHMDRYEAADDGTEGAAE